MNPAFVLLVIVALVAVWFLASGLYRLIGKFFLKIGGDAIHELQSEDADEGKEESETK